MEEKIHGNEEWNGEEERSTNGRSEGEEGEVRRVGVTEKREYGKLTDINYVRNL